MADNISENGSDALRGGQALILGGSGGIGFHVATALARAGYRLVVHGRDAVKLERKAAELRAVPADVSTIAADLSDGEAPPAVLDAARSSDLVVLAYGPFVNKKLSETSAADWRLVAMTCLALPGSIAAAAAAAMAERGAGRILLFGGTRTDAIRGFKANAAYAAAKTGLGVVAKSIAAEFGGRGVSCAVVCPGFVDTEYQDDGAKARLSAIAPRGTLIPGAEVAGLALYLLTGGMDLANGSIIVADRGLYAL
jgi:3-oxoacyl-[acyl-carrier protein] reductase